jgi:hypothetical protein
MKSAAFGICVLGVAVATAGLGAAAEPRQGYLGIIVGPVSDEVRAQIDLPARGGLTVRKLDPDGPARAAGVEVYDILVTFGQHDVTSPLELAEHIADAGHGTKVTLSVLRAGKPREIDVVLAERGDESDAAAFPAGPLPGMAQAQAHAQAGGEDGAGQTISRQTMSMQSSSVSINGRTQSTLVSTDGDGTVEVREVDGARTVTIRDAEGSEVHVGPLATDADRERVPEKFRDKVRKLEAQAPGGTKSSAKRRPRGAV